MKNKKFDSKDAIIIMLIIVCFALIFIYFNLAGSYNSLADLYINNCYMAPASPQGPGFNISGFI